MNRRTFLQSAGVAAAPLSDLEETVDVVVGTAGETSTTAGATVVGPEIRDVRYPLSFVPAIKEPGETLRVELSPDVRDPTAFLRPQVGTARPRIELEAIDSFAADSDIWRGETVTVVEYEVPKVRSDVVETSYDLLVEHDNGADGQRGAVTLVRNFPDEPRVVVFTDSHIADGSVEDSNHARESGAAMAEFTVEQVLEREPSDRWEEVQRVVAEVNLLDPDLVLTTGDYFSVQDYPGKYYMEYEDGHRVYSRLTAPTYTTLGNHDGYVQSTVDGKELYERYVAPEYYSLDIRPGLRLVSANTYDWSALDRTGASYGVSAWGGQIRDEQLEWLRRDLTTWRDANPDGDLLVLGHHNPAALQDDRHEVAETADGVPVAEQLARGADSEFVQGGQVWYGENRLDWRDLLAEVDAAVYLTGHTHRDRLARYHDGNIVRTETPGPNDFEPGQLHYVTRDGEVDDSYSQSELREVLREPDHGPLFAATTCSSAGTGQYDGYRVLTLDSSDGVDPSSWGGYPASQAFLDRETTDDGFTADHADLGLYARPAFQLAADVVEATDERVEVELRSDLEVTVSGASVVSLRDCSGVRVDGGRRLWRRRRDGRQDVKVGYEIPAGSTRTLVVECNGK